MELRESEPLGGRRGHRGGAEPQARCTQVGRGGRGKGAELQKTPQGPGKGTPKSTARVAPSWLSLSPGVPGRNRTKPRGFSQQRLCALGAEWHFPVSISSFHMGTMLIPLPLKRKSRINET